tara:strand:+ start:4901 stop:5671 length:771 start_codon:yes stop_codon:yes gene_type:complete
MKTKLIILGCGSSVGVPRIDGFWGKTNKKNKRNYRTRCSAIILKGSNSILLDTSPDLRHQLLVNNIKNISSVVFTHEHADQTNGIFELRPFFWKHKKRINIYGDSKTLKHIKKTHSYLFKKKIQYPAIVKANIIKNEFSLGKSKEKIYFKTIRVKHGLIYTNAYIFEKTAYISDTNDLSIVNINLFKNLNYLILDCLKIQSHPTHLNLKESIYVHNKLNPKKTILTNLHSDLDYEYLKRVLPKNMYPAYDGLKIEL